ADAESRDRADGHHDAGNGRLSDDREYPRQPEIPPAAHHRAHGQGDERRPREMPAGGRVGLSRQTRQYWTAAFRVGDVAPSLGHGKSGMNSDMVHALDLRSRSSSGTAAEHARDWGGG